MKTFIRAILVVLLVALVGGIAAAQYANFFFNGQQDYPLPGSGPCDASVEVKTAVPFTYDGHLWVLYTCGGNASQGIEQSVWARKFTGAIVDEAVVAPPPTYAAPAAPAVSTCTSIKPGPGWVCVNGGWRPPQ